jgi:hypothetical protein
VFLIKAISPKKPPGPTAARDSSTSINVTRADLVKNDNWFFTFLFSSDSAAEDSNKHSGKNSQGFTYYNSSLLNQRTSQYWMFNLLSSKHKAINTALHSKLRKNTVATAGIGGAIHSILTLVSVMTTAPQSATAAYWLTVTNALKLNLV